MSEEGEKTCPLCAEEMDLTDQQLRPCKCGYDICVWCWHHIMDMAEKDATEGRCPACRTPYNKEKIVGTTSKCERLVGVEKKQKSQKGKSKTTEGRKQLSSVRVIQRNLVYIVGLPLNLADEEVLQRKEYFGQYGKVLKVSISRTAAGTIQNFANNTCSVYITYAKEDEAIRSIQSVHGFVLDGRPLRACFGTTKYCHAWLRSMPCTNPECLYLHEFGSQEDSFTKDEIISEYTRGRVSGATTEMQRRSGSMLPPAAADDFSYNTNSSWPKPISTTNDTTNSMKSSPPNSSSGRSVALPAAASWGTRASNSQPVAANLGSSNGPISKLKLDTSSFPTPMVGPTSHTNELQKKESPTANETNKLEIPESSQQIINTNHRKTTSETPSTDSEIDVSDEETINQLSSDMSSLVIDKNHELQPSDDDEKLQEPFSSNKSIKTDNYATGEQSGLVQELQHLVHYIQHKVHEVTPISEVEADLLSFNNQRLRDPEVITHTNTNTHTGYVHNMPESSHSNNYSLSPNHQYPKMNGNLDPQFGNNTFDKPLVNGFEHSNGHINREHKSASDLGENSIISNILSMDFDPWDESLTSPQNLAKLLGDGDKHKFGDQSSSRKTQNCNQSRFSFAREDEYTDQGSSFAQNLSDFGVRQSFNRDYVSNTNGYVGQLSNGNGYLGQLSNGNGFSSSNFEEFDRTTASNHSSFSSNKIPVSRSQISAPPGFMGPSRAPPPGFSSNERMEPTYDNLSGNHMFDSSSLLRKLHQAPAPVYNTSVSELEFMDPAILAVGGRVPNGLTSQPLDMRSSFPSNLNSYENDNNNRLRLLVQRQQNQRLNDFGDSFSQMDGYGIPSSRMIEQNNRLSQYQQQQGSLGNFQQSSRMMSSNGAHWGDINNNNNGWNEVQNGNSIAMAEILRNERLGLNKYYSSNGGYEDTSAKYRMPTSSDMYNRTFGI